MTAATPTLQQPTEPVDVLVDLARDGEIDPWDIDIMRVTDKFLERLDEGDLARTGRGILYASILLRMKSDYVVDADPEEEQAEEEWEDEWGRGLGSDVELEAGAPVDNGVVDELEREFQRRLRRKRVRDRSKPETLDELIRELRERERGSWWKESREYDTSDGGGAGFHDDHWPEPTTEDAMQTAHEDDIESWRDEVWELIEEEFRHRDELLYAEVAPEGRGAYATCYVALMFLASDGLVELEQDEFYGDLWIQQPGLDDAPEDASAVADD